MDYALLGKSVLALGLMGVMAGTLLSVAARRFHVEVDPKVEHIFEVLPGSNCGACGMASCFAVAEAMAIEEVEPDKCVAGGQMVVDGVAGILGKEAGEVIAAVTARHCGGGPKAKRVYEYSGVKTCAAAAKLAGSPLACPGGCIGYGDCEAACPFDAITMDGRGLPSVDLDACTGCEICVRECPRGQIHLLSMVPDTAPICVRCNSHDKAKAKRGYCEVSCIACKKCEKECPADAIVATDFLAVVDYEKCTGCGVCVSVCPQDCIDLYGREAVVSATLADGRGSEVRGFEPTELSKSEKAAAEEPPSEGASGAGAVGDGAS